MSLVIGSPVPRPLGNGTTTPFPSTGSTYTDSTGAIVVPAGWGRKSWYPYRQTKGAVRGEAIMIGDSTMHGSGGLYSICQRLRDQATGATTGGPAGFGMADGGKGMFAGGENTGGTPIAYDSPEINGFVSSTFGGGFPDEFDNLDGQYFFDTGSPANHTLVLQFRQTGCRIWYSARANTGDFTYSIDGGGATTVKAFNASGTTQFVYVSGLTANTTHTLTITNLGVSTNGGGGGAIACYIALEPVNATGVVFSKYATSGDRITDRFFIQNTTSPWNVSQSGLRYQTPFGLVPTTVGPTAYTGAPVDSSYASNAKMNPVLAVSNLGFNDLTASVDATDLPFWSEYVKKFAGVCADAGCDGVIVTGQMPYNVQWPSFGAARFNALKTQAAASGLAFVDSFYPIGGPSLSYVGGTNQPHLTKVQYQAQADFLWNGLLGLV